MSTKRWRRIRNLLIKWHSEKEPPDKDRVWPKSFRRLRELYPMNPLFMHMTSSLCRRCSQALLGLCTLPTLMPPSCQYKFPMEHTPDPSPLLTLAIQSCSFLPQPWQIMQADGVACQLQTPPIFYLVRHSARPRWLIQELSTGDWPWHNSIKETSSPFRIKASSTRLTFR